MPSLLQDLKFGARMLARNPGFSATAVVVLALGIGANSAMFSLVNDFLLKPTMIAQPEQIAGIFGQDTQKPDTWHAFSYPTFADLRASSRSFSQVMAHNLALVGVSEGSGDRTRRVFSDVISSNYFSTLGVSLHAGRTFTAEEEKPGANVAVTIVSYPFWKKAGWADWSGHTIKINGRTYTVVGVAREGFTGTTALFSPTLYLPLGVYGWVVNDFASVTGSLASRDAKSLMLVGRLRPGVTQKSADAELENIAKNLSAAYPASNKDLTFLARPLSRVSLSTRPQTNRELYAASALLLSMAVLVLLVASFNVANMMLARGAARRREIAVRLALGASRGVILRQLFAEGLFMAVLGGMGGLALAFAGTAALTRSLSSVVPLDLAFSAGPDLRVIAATAAFCLLSTVLFALGPARDAARQDVISTLKGTEVMAGGRGTWGRLFARRNLLVMSQLSLSLMLVSVAGLFVRSAAETAQLTPGYRVEGQILAEVDAGLAGYDEARGRALYPKLAQRLQAIPGVASVQIAATVPFGIISLGKRIWRSDQPTSTKPVSAGYNIVSAGYFGSLGIPLLRGREFNIADSAPGRPAVVVIDQRLAKELWPAGNAVGQHLRLEDSRSATPREAEIVGIAGSVQETVMGDPTQPFAWEPFGQQYQSDVTLHVALKAGAEKNTDAAMTAVRREIREADAGLPILKLDTFRNHVEGSMDFWLLRMAAKIFALFGLVALVVAAVGLYGVRAYTVARRTREIGIRMAVGASASDAVGLILREGLAVSAVAAGVGIGLSLATGKLLAGMLYHVSAADPVVFGGAAGALVLVSMLACWFPARRAARVQPMTALRTE